MLNVRENAARRDITQIIGVHRAQNLAPKSFRFKQQNINQLNIF